MSNNPFANPAGAAQPNAGQQQTANPFGAPRQEPAPQQQQTQQRPAANPNQEFGQPASGGGSVINKELWRSYIGHLLLFEVTEFRSQIPTDNGEADAVAATVHVIDLPDAPELHEDALVFPPPLVTQLKKTALAGGGMVLGRLKLYTTKAKRETVELGDHTPQDADTARKYLAWRAGQGMQQPAVTQQQAPAQQQSETPPW